MSDESDEKPAESDDEPEIEAETSTPDAETDGSTTSDDERPDLDEDETADFDLDGVDLDAVDAAADEGDSTDEPDEGDSTDESDDADSAESDGETWGDMYVDVLGVVLLSIIEEYGDGDSDMTKADIEKLANEPPIALNEQADRVFEEIGGTRDLPPGQALVIGSATVAGSVILRETNAMDDLLNELGDREVF